jgi:hypothetical protein
MHKKTKEILIGNMKSILSQFSHTKTLCPYCDKTVRVEREEYGRFFGSCDCTQHKDHEGLLIELRKREYVSMTPYDIAFILTHELDNRGFAVRIKK